MHPAHSELNLIQPGTVHLDMKRLKNLDGKSSQIECYFFPGFDQRLF